MQVRLGIAILCTSILAGCFPLPPSASLDPPSIRLASTGSTELDPIQSTAWLKRVVITDTELDGQEGNRQVEITLTNNLVRFLRDGRYFHNAELLPGKPQPADLILQFEFDRYRQKRYFKGFFSSDISDISAILTVSRPDGQLVKKVTASATEKHTVGPYSTQNALPTGMKARTQVIEELLRKASIMPNLDQ